MVERVKYGIFGFSNTFKISLSNFESAVSLFDTSISSSPSVEEIFKAVIEVAYFTSNSYDLQSLRILAEWIFVGINKYDNQILNGIFLKDYSENLNYIRTQLDSLPEGKNLSGLNPAIIKVQRQQELQKIYQRILKFEKGKMRDDNEEITPLEMVLCNPVNYPDGIGDIEKCIFNEIQFLDESGQPSKR